ncbi:MAG: acyl-CoA thioesterase [Cyanobacteria bacterium]|nr:acyl-CoA thioesterase [Cyanobacteriota bacterium]MDW8201877.1 acyl-CoA thioesterase [Cyanobacteriota bacterium SKYGB_h_bin112]
MPKLTLELPIYTYDIDFAGHVSNIAYIRWMEIGRLHLLETIGLPVHELAHRGFTPVLSHTAITYTMPLFLGDTVHLDLWLSELKRASAEIQFRFYNSQHDLVASGQQGGLFVSLEDQKPHRLSLEERARFEPYVILDENDS